jgi:sugar/nucleoside kinase (ribokinase family)
MAQRCGGVGRNHVDALTRLGCDVNFISVVGNDDSGDYLLRKSSHIVGYYALFVINICCIRF